MHERQINILYRYPHVLAISGVVVVVQVLELLLLQRKYDLFTGGFLQPYSYTTHGEQFLFLALTLWSDIFLYGAIALVWFLIARRFNTKPLLSAYNFFFLSTIILGCWLTLKFKVLSYFNDTLNFVIIKNLGGGSFMAALEYAAQETTLIISAFSLMLLFYLLGIRIIRRVESRTAASSDIAPMIYSWQVILAALAVTLALLFYINSVPELRYGMSKKVSYDILSRLLNPLTDIDMDGFGELRYPADTEPFDRLVHPGALDIPGNGIDEDSLGGDFIQAPDEPDPLTGLQPVAGKHILFFVLESARWDLVGMQYAGQTVAPNIMRLLETGTAVPSAYSHTGYTSTSLKATFNRSLSAASGRKSLTDFLRESGYQLSFISGQDESFGDIASSTGMTADDAFLFDARSAIEDRVYPSTDPASLKLTEQRLVEEFRKHTAGLDWNNPQFIYINIQAAHFPYSYPGMPALLIEQPIPRNAIRAENRSWLEGTYWNAIANADRAIGEMIDVLRNLGVYEDTLVAIMGDHGESLFDDNFLGHGHALNESQTHIPLIFNIPDIDIAQAVGQVDIAEITLRLATGQFQPEQWQDKHHGVFQLIGPLHDPQLVGTVSYGGVWTTLDLRVREMYFSDLQRWLGVEAALHDPELGKRTRELLQQWESLRWRDSQPAPRT